MQLAEVLHHSQLKHQCKEGEPNEKTEGGEGGCGEKGFINFSIIKHLHSDRRKHCFTYLSVNKGYRQIT